MVRVRSRKCGHFIRFVNEEILFLTGLEPVSRVHPTDQTLLQPSKNFLASTGDGHRTTAFPAIFFYDFLNFLKRNGRDVNRRSQTSRL